MPFGWQSACRVFVDDAEAVDLAAEPLAEHAALFPQRVNLSVVSRIDDAAFRMRVWSVVSASPWPAEAVPRVGAAVVGRGLDREPTAS